jgi:hypothetical protein
MMAKLRISFGSDGAATEDMPRCSTCLTVPSGSQRAADPRRRPPQGPAAGARRSNAAMRPCMRLFVLQEIRWIIQFTAGCSGSWFLAAPPNTARLAAAPNWSMLARCNRASKEMQ